MSSHHTINLRTTPQLLHLTTKTFLSNLLTFLTLSLLILTFRTSIEYLTHLTTSYIDRDPSLQSLLSNLEINSRRHSANSRRHNRHRPFLQFTRVGVLDEDLFFYDEDDEKGRKGKVNCSRVLRFSGFGTKLGFSDAEFVDNGIRVQEIVRSGFEFSVDKLNWVDRIDGNGGRIDDNNGTVDGFGGKGLNLDRSDGNRDRTEGDNGAVVNGVSVRRLNLEQDSMALFAIASFMCASYSWVIIGFVVTYTWVLGIVFIVVVNYLLGRYSSFVSIMRDGSTLGMKKVSAFILMRWALRDAFTQLLGLWFFGEVEDQYSFFRLFLRLKLMPFSISSPWIRGFEKEISSFLFIWFLVDTVVAFIVALDPWAAIVDSQRGGMSIVKEGCYLISLMLQQAFHIKLLEILLCGQFLRWVIAQACGKFAAYLFQSMAEVYVMVAWLIFYFAAKCKDPNPNGRRFGRRDLDGLVEGPR